MQSSEELILTGVLMLIIGVGVIISVVINNTLRKEEVCVTGHLQDYTEKRTRGKHGYHTSYRGVYYYDIEGTILTYKSNIGYSPKSFVPDELKIYVRRNGTARGEKLSAIWLFYGIVPMIVGAVVICFGIRDILL